MRERYYASYGSVYDRANGGKSVFNGEESYSCHTNNSDGKRFNRNVDRKIYNDFRNAVQKAEELNKNES